jgi:hypothetical protein
MTWTRNDIEVRDICFFGNSVILVEPAAASGVLHLLDPVTHMEQRTVPIAGGIPAACASDGKALFVPVHAGNGRSTLLVFDANLAQVATRPIPPQLAEDRCLDLAWTPTGGFYGLFITSGGVDDAFLSTDRAYQFGLDGSVGAAVKIGRDGGLHSLGEFAP